MPFGEHGSCVRPSVAAGIAGLAASASSVPARVSSAVLIFVAATLPASNRPTVLSATQREHQGKTPRPHTVTDRLGRLAYQMLESPAAPRSAIPVCFPDSSALWPGIVSLGQQQGVGLAGSDVAGVDDDLAVVVDRGRRGLRCTAMRASRDCSPRAGYLSRQVDRAPHAVVPAQVPRSLPRGTIGWEAGRGDPAGRR